MTRIKIHISNVKLPFYPPCEVKCRLQNRVSTVAHGEGAHHLIPSLLPKRQMIPRTSKDPEHRLVKLSLATRNIAMSVRIRAQPIRALETMS